MISSSQFQVDRLWSILPGLYSCIITIYSSSSSSLSSCSTMLLMSLLTSVWGARLTFQFFMKDGYTLTGEDYRWKYVKQVLGDNWWVLQGFNLFFVVIYQNILLFLLVVPQLVMVGEDIAITAVDVLIGCAGFVLIALETVADNQQQCFQRRKYKAISEGAELTGDLKAGFVKGGLFSYCRHPNFVSEVLIWWTFAMFPVSRLGIGWYFVGAVNLTALFCGSQDLTEQISAKKYPEYAEYQKRVPAYIPNLRMMSIK